jgi:hypothetical protein
VSLSHRLSRAYERETKRHRGMEGKREGGRGRQMDLSLSLFCLSLFLSLSEVEIKKHGFKT